MTTSPFATWIKSALAAAVLLLLSVTAHAQTLYYLHADHLNTPRLLTDQNQAIVWRWDPTEPFGNSVGVGSMGRDGFVVTVPLRLPGQYFDKETNLNYNYFRDYDPAIGRYIQSDPIGLDGSINTYLYGNANPLNYIDPYGLMEIYRMGGVTFSAYPGPQAGGIEHARFGPGESYHIHLRDSAGNEARISSETWRPLTPEDERIFNRSKQMQNVCEKLTEGEKKFFDRVNRQIFHRGAPTLNQLLRIGEMGGGGRGLVGRRSEE